MVIASMNENAICHPRKVVTFRNIKTINDESFCEELRAAPWHVGSIFESIDDQWFYWSSLPNYIIDQHTPIKRMRVRATDVPYMNIEWKEAIRRKRKYAKKIL